MDRITSIFFGITVLISLIQTLHAISEEEYQQRTSYIKSKPEIKQFLKDNEFILSQYGVFNDKMANIASHARKTQPGSLTIKHIQDETDTALNTEGSFSVSRYILEGIRRILTSEVGIKNLFSVARFIKSEVEIRNLLEMCLSWKRAILEILLSKDGLECLVMVKENSYILENNEKTAELLNILDKGFPVLTLSTDSANTSQQKANIQKMKSLTSQLEADKNKGSS